MKTLSVRAFGPSGPGLFTYTRVKYNTLFSGFRYLTRFSQKTKEVLSGLSSNHQFYSKKVAGFFLLNFFFLKLNFIMVLYGNIFW